MKIQEIPIEHKKSLTLPLLCVWSIVVTGCLGRLQFSFLELFKIFLDKAYALRNEVGLDDFQRSLTTSIILWKVLNASLKLSPNSSLPFAVPVLYMSIKELVFQSWNDPAAQLPLWYFHTTKTAVSPLSPSFSWCSWAKSCLWCLRFWFPHLHSRDLRLSTSVVPLPRVPLAQICACKASFFFMYLFTVPLLSPIWR